MRHKSEELMKQIMDYAEQFQLLNHRSPYTSEIADALGIVKSTVYKYLVAMNDRGMLSYRNGEIVTERTNKISLLTKPAAVLGSVSCGMPQLVQWCKEEGMDLEKITPSKYDSVLGEGTGAGMIFGNTGGVMEAALRTVYRVLEGKEAPADFYQLRPVRGLNNRKEAEVTIAGKNLRVCILYGTAAAEEFLAEDMSGYHFVEVMTCPGGCISGAGQPDCGSVPVSDAVRKKRIASLYQADERAQYRNSMDNPEIGMIYNEFFKEPLSLLSETLLHTTYKSK